MALINPPSLYTAGAVKFDSTPSVNFYAQLMARQQAKRDALDQYYSKLMSDTEGRENQMRTSDIEQGWGQKFNDWQSFYMNPQNRKAILNPSKYGYEKVNKFNMMHQDLIADARKSTQELGKEKLINEHRISGKWFPTDSDVNEAHQISKSIYDPSRKIVDTDPSTGMQVERDPDVSYLSLNIPDVTPTEKNQMMKGAVGKIEPATVAGEPDKARGLITMTSAYRPEDVKSIATNYANNVAQNRKFTNSYERLMHDEATYHKYNEVFKKYFPEAGDIQTPAQMAAAEAAMNAEGATSSKVQKWTDPQEWYSHEATRKRNRIQIAKMNLGNAAWLKTQPNYKDLQGSDDDIVSTNKIIGEVSDITRNGKPSAEGHGWVDINEPTILSGFKDLAPSTTSPPNGMRYNPYTNQMKFVYTDNKGNEEYVGIEPSSYLNYKVKQSYPNKDIGNINNALRDVYDRAGGRLESMLAQYSDIEKKAALQKASAPAKTSGKVHRAKMADGTVITSTDGINWYDAKGKKIE